MGIPSKLLRGTLLRGLVEVGLRHLPHIINELVRGDPDGLSLKPFVLRAAGGYLPSLPPVYFTQPVDPNASMCDNLYIGSRSDPVRCDKHGPDRPGKSGCI